MPDVPQSEGLNHPHVMNALLSSENNFQSQLSALLNEIHLSDNSKCMLVCKDLEETFSASHHGCRAYPFGSAVTGLGFKGSDLDVFMDLSK
jgi:DNA polymerase sigma